jgi:hypothetical protein
VATGVDLPTLSAILGQTKIQITKSYVHPAKEQKRLAAVKLETIRLAGIVEPAKKIGRYLHYPLPSTESEDEALL